MPVYSKLKTAFIRVPKTASSSMTSSLNFNSSVGGGIRMHSKKIRQHSTAIDIRDVIGKEMFESLFKFAFVRNPWDRAVSFYFSYMNSGVEHRFNEKASGLKTIGEFHNKAVKNKDSGFESCLWSG